MSLDLSSDEIYTTIPAGSSVAVNHTGLGPLFDFETHGTGKFSFAPKTIFQTGLDSTPVRIEADPVQVDITHDVQKRELIPLERRLSTPVCSDSGRLSVMQNALADARARAGGAATDIQTHPNGPEYTTYFGGDSQNDSWFRMDRIAGDLASSGTRK